MPFAVLIGAMVMLSQPVAAPRTGGRACGRHVGLAIHCAGAGRRAVVRRGGDDHLQSARRVAAGALEAARSARCSATAPNRPAVERQRILGAPAQSRTASRSSMQRPAADQGLRLGGVTVFTFDDGQPVPGADRGENRGPGRRLLAAAATRAFTRRCSAGRPAMLRSQDQPDAEQVRESFATPETVPFWELPCLYRHRRARRTGRRRLSTAIPEADGAAVPARRDGAAGGRRQPALLPLRRRAEDGAERRRRGLSALRAVEGDRRPEQGRAPVAGQPRRGCRWLSAVSRDFVALLYQEDG